MRKILVIDDDPTIIQLIKSRLESLKYMVNTAQDGLEGLDNLKKDKPDLIILDIQMPHMDGLTFIQEFKKEDSFRQIPIIVFTVKETMQDIFKLEGAKEYMIKPMDINVLIEKVKKYVPL